MNQITSFWKIIIRTMLIGWAVLTLGCASHHHSRTIIAVPAPSLDVGVHIQ